MVIYQQIQTIIDIFTHKGTFLGTFDIAKIIQKNFQADIHLVSIDFIQEPKLNWSSRKTITLVRK